MQAQIQLLVNQISYIPQMNEKMGFLLNIIKELSINIKQIKAKNNHSKEEEKLQVKENDIEGTIAYVTKEEEKKENA